MYLYALFPLEAYKYQKCSWPLDFHLLLKLASLTKILGISRNFRNARQEDAHEYMVNLLESMHKCCLPSGVPSESPSAYEKSLVHKIFGGRLRSQVIFASVRSMKIYDN